MKEVTVIQWLDLPAKFITYLEQDKRFCFSSRYLQPLFISRSLPVLYSSYCSIESDVAGRVFGNLDSWNCSFRRLTLLLLAFLFSSHVFHTLFPVCVYKVCLVMRYLHDVHKLNACGVDHVCPCVICFNSGTAGRISIKFRKRCLYKKL
jgi:hypothetical protein